MLDLTCPSRGIQIAACAGPGIQTAWIVTTRYHRGEGSGSVPMKTPKRDNQSGSPNNALGSEANHSQIHQRTSLPRGVCTQVPTMASGIKSRPLR
ncbi:hypothetical protein BC834DRAFT_901024 [Gloeopeniophorella convolvens]|nr:hypothetical protein BC834DRAFT_901024 [Gloeopeniophorella convolvens]